MEPTLRCHSHVSRYVHRGAAAISTTLGFILPALDWALGRRMVINHSRFILT